MRKGPCRQVNSLRWYQIKTREEEVVLHLFESDEGDDGLLQCPFCLANSDMPPRNFASSSVTILLQRYKDNHAHILAKACQERLDILYSD
ncbi:hypothetical protein Moror_13925 [Moniliophthora roreri MCA 2997]|uniref:Uncharacterized protein n=1 Tax=Moniliophthora roreri (strain MCA 2997) TaxID=1381753 RepID=V2YTS3_MONRO|nr:hypothetical protein Moror_13925 [Moniliophthora roreri MCA 2997]